MEVQLLPLKSSYSESSSTKIGSLNSSDNKSPPSSGLFALPTTLELLGQNTPEFRNTESAHGEVLQRPHPAKEDDLHCLS